MSAELIQSEADLSNLLDRLLADRGDGWWNAFYQDRAKPCPFFVESPDEGLIDWVGAGRIPAGRALELGCGNGRNAIYLAQHGFDVVAVDFSQKAIDWAAERVTAAGVSVELRCESAFERRVDAATYDLVYDSGCFHHMAPHRRWPYVDLVGSVLRPGGWFGLVCFRPEGGSGFTDLDVYERRSMGGGLGYTESDLRAIWGSTLIIHELRQMHKGDALAGSFGEEFLWVMLAQKPPA